MEHQVFPQRAFARVARVVRHHQHLAVVLGLEALNALLLPWPQRRHVPGGRHECRCVLVGPWSLHSGVVLDDVDPFVWQALGVVGLDGEMDGEVGDVVAELLCNGSRAITFGELDAALVVEFVCCRTLLKLEAPPVADGVEVLDELLLDFLTHSE